MRGIFSSTMVTEFDVVCEFALFGKILAVTIPVTLCNMDGDTTVRLSTTLAPYEPVLTSVRYGLMAPPALMSFP